MGALSYHAQKEKESRQDLNRAVHLGRGTRGHWWVSIGQRGPHMRAESDMAMRRIVEERSRETQAPGDSLRVAVPPA